MGFGGVGRLGGGFFTTLRSFDSDVHVTPDAHHIAPKRALRIRRQIEMARVWTGYREQRTQASNHAANHAVTTRYSLSLLHDQVSG